MTRLRREGSSAERFGCDRDMGMGVQPAAIDESYQAGLIRFIISGCGCTGHGASERGAEAAWGKANRAIENREGPNARASRRGHGVGFSRVRSDYCISGRNWRK